VSARDSVVDALRHQAAACAYLDSRFYDALLTNMAADAARGGPTFRLLEPYAPDLVDDAYALRVLGGIHFRVMRGGEPALAGHYPSTGGDGDADAAWPAFLGLLDDPPPELVDALRRPPQTNEVGRSASLVGGFLAVADAFGVPLRVLELGASAGLNLQFDRYRYDQGAAGFGPSDSPVRFIDLWSEVTPPFGAPLQVAERRGCDRDPIDVSVAEDRMRLLAYVWPDVTARFDRTRAALELAAASPPPVDRADAADWIAEQLSVPTEGRATVVFHSIVWQYLDAGTAARVRTTIEAAGAAAARDAPVAWLRLEPDDAWRAEGRLPPSHAQLRLRVWPGGDDRHLADASFHAGPLIPPAPGASGAGPLGPRPRPRERCP
jgi:hypothetical protein